MSKRLASLLLPLFALGAFDGVCAGETSGLPPSFAREIVENSDPLPTCEACGSTDAGVKKWAWMGAGLTLLAALGARHRLLD